MVKLLPVPIRFAVKEIAKARGYRNARQLAADAKVALGTMYGIWDNKKTYVHLKVLERLSDTLSVPVGMLLTDKPEQLDKRGDAEAGLAPSSLQRAQPQRSGRDSKPEGRSRGRTQR